MRPWGWGSEGKGRLGCEGSGLKRSAAGAVSQGLESVTGDAYFSRLLLHITEVLDVSHALVGEFGAGAPVGVRTLAAVLDGREAPPFEYALAGTPCAETGRTGACVHAGGVRAAFPRDRMLAEHGIESYAGVRLADQSGAPLGILAIMGRKPLGDPGMALTLLEAFAGRTAAELVRRKAELALRQREEELRCVFEQLPGATWTTDLDLRLTSVRQGARTTTSAPVSERLGRTIPELLGGAEPEHPAVAAHLAALQGQAGAFEAAFDGRQWDARVQPLLDAGGSIVGCLGHTLDITERVRAEAELKRALGWRDAIVEGAPDAIFISDASANFVIVNAAACELTGYTRTELLGMGIRDLHDVEDLGAYRRYHSKILAGQDAVTLAPIRRRDGRKVPTEFNNRRITVDGAPYMLTVARDVTRRLRTEEEVRGGRRRLRALSRGLLAAQERERARIALELHDQVGQNLTALKLQLLSARGGAPAASAALDAAVTLLDSILDGVRTLSFELRPSTLDELGLPAALRGYATRQAELAGLDLRLSLGELPGDLRPDVETAAFRIAQEAITNVVRHAGAGRLWVRLRERAGAVDLVIEDDGVGLGGGSASGDPKPSGLGIVGMDERAGAAGGRLTLAPRARGGVRVRAHFPARTAKKDGRS